MNGYRIKQNNNQWYFELFPSNNHSQAMGRSMDYTSFDECKKAIIKFKDFVENNKLNFPVENKLVKKTESGRYVFQYIESNITIFWRTIPYGVKKNCYKGIESIYKNIDEYTTNYLED